MHQTEVKFFQPAPVCGSRGGLNPTGLYDPFGVPVDPFKLTKGVRLDFESLRYDSAGGGELHDWNWGFGLVPIIRVSVAAAVESSFGADIQCIPVRIASIDEQLMLMNVVTVRDCVDEERSRSRRIQPGEAAPEHVGRFRSLGCLTIDESRVFGADIFRLRDFEVCVVVSEQFRKFVIQNRWTGIDFIRTYVGCPPGVVRNPEKPGARNIQ